MRTCRRTRRFIAFTLPIALLSIIGLASPQRAVAELPDGSGPFGGPRPWEGGMGVGPYSVVNLRTGHVLTTLHIVSWGGTGGGLSFNLYHNSPDDNSGIEVTPDMEKAHDPYDPITEPIWRTSFSSSIHIDGNGNAIVVRDDGTEDLFTLDIDEFVAPPGCFDTLVAPGSGPAKYVLTSKHQSVAMYNESGWLISVSDASGNTIRCIYHETEDWLIGVVDATKNEGLSRPGRRLDFVLDSAGRLLEIEDPQYNNGDGRAWVLTRSTTTHTFIKLTDPLDHDIEIGYDLHGRITTLEDKNGSATSFSYDEAKLIFVSDPDPLDANVTFAYIDTGSGTSKTEYTDRKDKVWTYHFEADDNLVSMTNPLSKTWYAAYEGEFPQLLHHATSVTNPLNKTWTMEWDEFGNLEATTDPIGHRTERTYDGLNNLTSVTPPADDTGELNEDKTVTIEYADEFNPTLPTKIIEDPNGDPAETIISYYHEDGPLMSNPAWNGKVERVTDPNGVQTMFEYDNWGQSKKEMENPVAQQIDINWEDYTFNTTIDVSGHMTGAQGRSNDGNMGCSSIQTDAGGNQYSSICTACAELFIPGVPMSPLASWANEVTYDGMRRPLSMDKTVEDMQHLDGTGHEQSTRTYGVTYDAVGRPTVATITTNEPGFNLASPAPVLTRTQSVSYNDATGSTTYTGPDGEAVIVTTDDCSRTYQVSRTTPAGRVITTAYAYDDAGRVLTVSNGNDTTTTYAYDDAGRVESATHRRGTSGAIFLKQEYDWTPDGLLLMVAEYDSASPIAGAAVAVIYYEYDNRNRLISEEREDYGGTGVAPVEYHYEYTYDLGGNRLSKADLLNDVSTFYRYDVSDVNEGNVDEGQHSNRLLYYWTQINGSCPATIEEGWYHYGAAGHVNRFIKWKASDGMAGDYKRVHAYAFHYDKAGRMWISVSMRGELGIGGDPDTEGDNYAELASHYDLPAGSVLQNVIGVAAMEYRYNGSGRQRYLVRPRTPDEDLQPIGGAADGTWHDFVGDEIYNDYGVTFIPAQGQDPASLEADDRMSYLSGVGYDDQTTNYTPTSQPVYEHGDQIGTNRRQTATDYGSTPGAPLLARATYSAFGEVIDHTALSGINADASFKRGYAGAWGYQAGDPDTVTVDTTGTGWGTSNQLTAPADPMTELGWLHVGERYYDPGCGRFVMRDPIGIDGGFNTYAYTENNPLTNVDPDGLELFGTNGPVFGYGRGLNKGYVRVGWSSTRVSARKWVPRMCFRVGTNHLRYGAGAFGPVIGGCVLAASVGSTIGSVTVAIANPVFEHIYGESFSDRMANRLWDMFGDRRGGNDRYRPY